MKLQKVFDKIWIGPGDDIKRVCLTLDEMDDWEGHRATDIAILGVAEDYPEVSHRREILYIHAGLNDGPPDWSLPYGGCNGIVSYVNAVRSLDFLSSFKEAVLVYCHAGVSRSGAVVAIYIGWKLGVTFEFAVQMLKSVYPRANPHPKHAKEAQCVINILRRVV